MENTTILAQYLGILYFVVSLAALIHYKKVHAMLKSIRKSRSIFFGLGTIVLAMGLLIVMIHNDWQSFTGIIVGVIGWGAICESLLYLFLPRRSLTSLIAYFDNKNMITAGSIIGIGIGIVLLLAGIGII